MAITQINKSEKPSQAKLGQLESEGMNLTQILRILRDQKSRLLLEEAALKRMIESNSKLNRLFLMKLANYM